VVLCALAAVAGAWFTVLNVAAAAGSWPYALHGRGVEVVIRRCDVSGGARTCRGDYRIASAAFGDREVLGAGTASVGSRLGATVDRRHPGTAVTGHPAWALAEAACLAWAGLAVCAVALRAAVRARRRRGSAPSRSATPGRAPDADDPLAGVRRRRFGAGG